MLEGAIIGFGQIASKGHWPSYATSKDVSIVAIVDPSPARQSLVKELSPSIHTYNTVEELFQNEKLDFVDICTPPASHVSLALQALGKGCHVLCEKPLCLTTADFQKLEAGAKQADRALYTVHNWKFAPIYQRLFYLLSQKTIGDLWHVQLSTLRNSHCKGAADGASSKKGASEDWRLNRAVAGGGIVIDHGWHAFYLLLNTVQADPVSLEIKMGIPEEGALEEEAQGQILHHNNVISELFLTWRANVRRNLMTVYGEKGTILLDDDRLVIARTGQPVEEVKFPAGLSAGSTHEDWFEPLLRDFVDEMTDSSYRGTNLAEAKWCTTLTESAYSGSAAPAGHP